MSARTPRPAKRTAVSLGQVDAIRIERMPPPGPMQRLAQAGRMLMGLPMLLVFAIYHYSQDLIIISGGPRYHQMSARLNWRNPLAIPFVVLVIVLSPLILLVIAVLFVRTQVSNHLARRRHEAAQKNTPKP